MRWQTTPLLLRRLWSATAAGAASGIVDAKKDGHPRRTPESVKAKTSPYFSWLPDPSLCRLDPLRTIDNRTPGTERTLTHARAARKQQS